MARKPYRVEMAYSKKGPKKYFLVKDIFFNGRRSKVRSYLGSGETPPSYEKVEIYRKFAFDLEIKAAKAVGKLGVKKYKTEFLSLDELGHLEELKYLHKRFHQLLTANEIKMYERNFELQYVGGTTKIEGNTLSLQEAKDLLFEGISPKYKSLREINEVQNFIEVKKYRDSYGKKINLNFVREMHALVMRNIDNDSAGIFRRTDDIGIGGCEIPVCPAMEIEEKLTGIIDYYYTRLKTGYHPFEDAIMFHYFFEMVHPFTNGNGRVGREILNYMLMRGKYPKLLFLGEEKERAEYLDALRFGNNEEYPKMVSKFYEIIMSQRLEILLKNIETIIHTIPEFEKAKKDRAPQARLIDYGLIV